MAFSRLCLPSAGHPGTLQRDCQPPPQPPPHLSKDSSSTPPSSPKGRIRFLCLSESLPQEASRISPWPSAAGLGRGPQLAPRAWVEWKLFGLSPVLLHQEAGGGAGSHRGLGLHSSRLPPPPTAV